MNLQEMKGRQGFGVIRPRGYGIQSPLADIIPDDNGEMAMKSGQSYQFDQPTQPDESADDTSPVTRPSDSMPVNDYGIGATLAKIQGLQNKDYGPRQHGGFKDILANAGLQALKGIASAQPGNLGTMIGGAIGGAGAGAVGGAFDGSQDNRTRDNMQLGTLYGQYGREAQVRDNEQGAKLTQARINTIPIDDANNRQKIIDARQAKADTQQGQNLRKLSGMPTFDPSNPAHIALAKAAGKTDAEIAQMKPWDFRNPIEHLIGGERYKLDRSNGEYFPTNLPIDQQKELVPFDAVDANGRVIGTYNVLPAQAARMKQQFALKGIEIQARKDLQASSQGFQAGQTQAKQTYQTGVRAAKNDEEANKTLIAIDAQEWTPEQKATAKENLYKLHPNLRP